MNRPYLPAGNRLRANTDQNTVGKRREKKMNIKWHLRHLQGVEDNNQQTFRFSKTFKKLNLPVPPDRMRTSPSCAYLGCLFSRPLTPPESASRPGVLVSTGVGTTSLQGKRVALVVLWMVPAGPPGRARRELLPLESHHGVSGLLPGGRGHF